MNIIVVSGRPAKTRSIQLGPFQLAGLGLVLLLLVAALAALADHFYAPRSSASESRDVLLPSMLLNGPAGKQDSLNAMAVRLGQMQAQVVRLEAMGERLAKLAGLGKEFNFAQPPSRGGAESDRQRPLSERELEQEMQRLAALLEERGDQLAVLESAWLQRRTRASATPSATPVPGSWQSSGFGMRIDPFTGKQAFHEGLDFVAEVGTPIRAAAGGVVVFADRDAGYGKMIGIDHGNGYVTRYAHASKLTVRVGDIVMKGQKVAEVGSTGRSSGPHLHFEVRYQGAVQNPSKYLEPAG